MSAGVEVDKVINQSDLKTNLLLHLSNGQNRNTTKRIARRSCALPLRLERNRRPSRPSRRPYLPQGSGGENKTCINRRPPRSSEPAVRSPPRPGDGSRAALCAERSAEASQSPHCAIATARHAGESTPEPGRAHQHQHEEVRHYQPHQLVRDQLKEHAVARTERPWRQARRADSSRQASEPCAETLPETLPGQVSDHDRRAVEHAAVSLADDRERLEHIVENDCPQETAGPGSAARHRTRRRRRPASPRPPRSCGSTARTSSRLR